MRVDEKVLILAGAESVGLALVILLFPPSPKPNLPVNDYWHEGLKHGSDKGQEMLAKIYSHFTM